MGSKFRRAYKILVGKPQLLGFDSAHWGSRLGNGSPAPLYIFNALNNEDFIVIRDGQLDCASFELSSELSNGESVGVELRVNNAVVSSGNIIGGERRVVFDFLDDSGASSLPLSEGDTISWLLFETEGSPDEFIYARANIRYLK